MSNAMIGTKALRGTNAGDHGRSAGGHGWLRQQGACDSGRGAAGRRGRHPAGTGCGTCRCSGGSADSRAHGNDVVPRGDGRTPRPGGAVPGCRARPGAGLVHESPGSAGRRQLAAAEPGPAGQCPRRSREAGGLHAADPRPAAVPGSRGHDVLADGLDCRTRAGVRQRPAGCHGCGAAAARAGQGRRQPAEFGAAESRDRDAGRPRGHHGLAAEPAGRLRAAVRSGRRLRSAAGNGARAGTGRAGRQGAQHRRTGDDGPAFVRCGHPRRQHLRRR